MSSFPKNQDQEFAFDFSGFMPSDAEETMVGAVNTLIEASSQQTLAAIELTKVALLAKNSASTLTEDDVFAVFKRASQVVQETSPLKSFWEKVTLEHE